MTNFTTIPESTYEVIRQSTFTCSAQPYFFVKAGAVGDSSQHLAVLRDRVDTTVVTQDLSGVEILGRNPDKWALISIVCANPFYCVGFIAAIAQTFTQAGIDFCLMSAFTQDLVFVKEAERENAIQHLQAVGFKKE